MQWIKAPKLPDELLRSYYCKIYNNVFKKEFKKQVLITLDGTWQTGDFDTVIEWLDESKPNEPSIDEITRLQNIGIAMANDIEQKRKEIESLKIQDEGLEEAAEKEARLHYHPMWSKEAHYACTCCFKAGYKYSKQLNK